MKNYTYFLNPISKAYNLADKDLQVSSYCRYMVDRTMQMFKYENLPSTIPQRELELQLQMFGHVGVFDHNGDLYALRGGFGGEPNPYYMPTKYVISNPALKFSNTFTIDDDIVIIRNDSMYTGLTNLFLRYATQLCENDISMLNAIINTRITNLIIAGDDASMESARKYQRDIIDGKLSIIGDNKILEGIRTNPNATENRSITDLIEVQQYLKAGWYNELGLNANYNMKREAINSDEAQMNHDALYPLIDDLLACRQECIEKVNDMFGTDIKVSFNSVWEIKDKELDAVEDAMESDPESVIATDVVDESVADDDQDQREEDEDKDESK